MKRLIAFCLIGAATLAQSQDLSRSAQTLVVRSGLAEQLKSVTKQLAFTGAMLRASLRMGAAIEKSLQKKPA